ncbi:DUF2058 domain-containing protein [Rhodanobacter lindaniclasticus]
MAESLRDQLLKSGIVKKVQPERSREPKRPAGKPPAGPAKGRGTPEIDLAKAYALRGQAETRERKQAEREAAEQARLRRERKLRIQQLLEGKALNKADAEQVRNFEYAGKIRRIHVDATQLAALNAGELGVVQHAGRYLLVSRDTAEQLREVDANHVALLVAPGTAGTDDDGVPDDLMW